MATRTEIKQVVVRTTVADTNNLQMYLNKGYKVVICNQVSDGILEYIVQGSEKPISLEKD